VQQHRVGTDRQSLLELAEGVDLDLNLDQMTDVAADALNGRTYAASHRDVVVLDKYRIIEAEAMIGAAADAHGIFLDGAQTGGGLARAADARAIAPHAFHNRRGLSSNAAQMAKKVERDALAGQDAARRSVYPGDDFARREVAAIGPLHADDDRGVDQL